MDSSCAILVRIATHIRLSKWNFPTDQDFAEQAPMEVPSIDDQLDERVTRIVKRASGYSLLCARVVDLTGYERHELKVMSQPKPNCGFTGLSFGD